jgi:Ca2+-binding RTX toxin-like protein
MINTISTVKTTDLSQINYSGVATTDALLDNSVNWNYLNPARTVLYYTFDTKNFDDSKLHSSVEIFNTSQQMATIEILQYVCSITGIKFEKIAAGKNADIHFANTDLNGTSVTGLTNKIYSYTSSNNIVIKYTADAYIYLDNVEWAKENGTLTAETRGYETLLHEIGHALGLKHPFETPNKLAKDLDNTNNTVMSYTYKGDYKTEFQSYDLAALKWIYSDDGLGGAGNMSVTITKPTQSTAGADILIGTKKNDTINGLAGNDTIEGGKGNDKLTGGSGKDTFVFDLKDYDFVGDFAPRAQNLDTITDFIKGQDIIKLSAGFAFKGFKNVASMKLSGDASLIYNNATHALYFDADGSETHYSPTKFIQFSGQLNLGISDLQLV